MLKTILSVISKRYTPEEARAIAFLILEDAFGITRTEVYADKVRQFFGRRTTTIAKYLVAPVHG